MIGTYDDLALEYYDADRHPTCANFREASRVLLKTWLPFHAVSDGVIVEVGAGMSLVAELMAGAGRPLDSLTLLDSSARMLEYSDIWIARGASRTVASADDMGLPPQSVDTLVSSLGDPYNTSSFWSQVGSILKPGGTTIFTTPSFAWATAFRKLESPGNKAVAEFQLRDGRRIAVPSVVLPTAEQIALMRQHGLCVIETRDIPLSVIESSLLSPKLGVLCDLHESVVTGYVARKGSSPL